jgi:hypothetical protein
MLLGPRVARPLVQPRLRRRRTRHEIVAIEHAEVMRGSRKLVERPVSAIFIVEVLQPQPDSSIFGIIIAVDTWRAESTRQLGDKPRAVGQDFPISAVWDRRGGGNGSWSNHFDDG